MIEEHENIKFCPDKLCSLRINGTNDGHNMRVQNNVDIYKRLILNRNRRSGHHNFHVFLTGKNSAIHRHHIVIRNQNKIFYLFIAQFYNWSFLKHNMNWHEH